ncbi:unnamed protein product, partial [Durusdinium trenchii]
MFGVTEDLAAEPQLPPDLPRGAVSLLILAQNINLPLLAARSDLASAFRWALQEDVAAQLCGAGVAFAPGQVEVRLLADSAAIPVTVTPSHGLPCHELHRLLSTKQLRWCAGSKLDHLEGFSQVCLSPSWCFFSVGLPSIVAASDELASTTAGSPLEAEGRVARASLNQDLPAVPDEPDFTLPRSLERTGHTPREEEKGHAKKPPRASPKRKAAAKA